MKTLNGLKSIIAVAALALPACATVTRGAYTEFKIVTEPTGASVTTTLKTSETRKAEKRRSDFIKYGIVNEADAPTVEPEFIGCDATPCTLRVARRSNFTTTVSLPGYHPATVEVTSGFGKGSAQSSAKGTAAGVAGGYILTYGVAKAATSGFVAIASAFTTTGAAASTAGTAATSAATTAATGIGVTMIGVDLLTGAMLDIRPNPLVLVLVPETEPAPEGDLAVIDTTEKYNQLVAEQTAMN